MFLIRNLEIEKNHLEIEKDSVRLLQKGLLASRDPGANTMKLFELNLFASSICKTSYFTIVHYFTQWSEMV